MGLFLKLLRQLLPLAKAAALATQNKVDDAAVLLLEQILDSIPADEAKALIFLDRIHQVAVANKFLKES